MDFQAACEPWSLPIWKKHYVAKIYPKKEHFYQDLQGTL